MFCSASGYIYGPQRYRESTERYGLRSLYAASSAVARARLIFTKFIALLFYRPCFCACASVVNREQREMQAKPRRTRRAQLSRHPQFTCSLSALREKSSFRLRKAA